LVTRRAQTGQGKNAPVSDSMVVSPRQRRRVIPPDLAFAVADLVEAELFMRHNRIINQCAGVENLKI
jgi:hypothetical protein